MIDFLVLSPIVAYLSFVSMWNSGPKMFSVSSLR